MSGSTERSSYANNQVFLVFNILSATVLAWFVLYGNIFPSHQANIHHTPAATDIMSDAVFLRNARLTAMVGLDCWHRDKKQPVLVSMTIPVEIQLAGETDDVLNTVNYGTVFKAIDKGLSGSSHNTLDSFAEEACRIGLKVGNGKRVSSTVKLPKVVKEAEGGDGGVSLEVEMVVDETGKATVHSKVLRIDNLRLACILGINDHERKGKQIVALNLELYDGKVPEKTDYQALFAPLIKQVEESDYLTLEALAWAVAKTSLLQLGFEKVKVTIEKPNAYGLADCPGVVMTRTIHDVSAASH